jgi:hypothetical protein
MLADERAHCLCLGDARNDGAPASGRCTGQKRTLDAAAQKSGARSLSRRIIIPSVILAPYHVQDPVARDRLLGRGTKDAESPDVSSALLRSASSK